jgi:hypothetical protein
MIELTERQRQEIPRDGGQIRMRDPATNTEYVLVRADVSTRLRHLLEQAEDDVLQDAWADAVDEARSEMSGE